MLPTWAITCAMSRPSTWQRRTYGRWLGRATKLSQYVWVNGGDASRRATRQSTENSPGLREGDGGAHLITYHPAAGGLHLSFPRESWLDFNMIETWTEWYRCTRSAE